MKTQISKISIILLFVIISGSAYAQDNNDDDKERKGTTHDFGIDLGINNYLENGNPPSDSDAPYTVKPFGSWYVALKSINNTHINGPLHLIWGGDISWYNFKFENEDIRMLKGDDGVFFVEEGDVNSKKSKLTAAYVNASVVPMLAFGDSKNSKNCHWKLWDKSQGFRIGAGMYAGYKIGSYTKVVTKEGGDKDKDKDHDSFYLNNFRYGLRVQAGFRGIDLFFNYDLNELFADNKGPKLNAFSIGVVL
ncbi:hypothetical protein [Fulvivirga sediminis]|uniref:Outer membrane protein beta-barrel domain-containing protein n=1 Tax=Fulvivirga sediminis TaxID=2803949 RepID=A0A937F5F5_9BACT|nr:hypothetical protein [Fulvivirga sediminis]MBL3655282.1 hypothetical protein [Fulvivirga sediminis]